MRTQSNTYRLPFAIVLLLLSLGGSGWAQNSGYYEPGTVVVPTRSLPPAYDQWREPTTLNRNRPEVQYYPPPTAEYLPTPKPQTAAAPAPAPTPTPQAPYAYPPNLAKAQAEATKAAPAPPPAPVPAPPKSAEDLETLRRQNYALSQQLAAAQQVQSGRGYVMQPGRVAYINHRVRRGDSLWGLAIRYKTTIQAIRDFNTLGRKDNLAEGTMIGIPVRNPGVPVGSQLAYVAPTPQYQPPAPPQPAPVVSKPIVWGKHIVRPNETLSLIAQHYNVSTRSMQSANGLRSANRIYVGQELTIPGRSTAEVAEMAKKPVPTAPPPAYLAPAKPKPAPTEPAMTYVPPPPPRTAGPHPVSTTNRGITAYRIQKNDTLDSVAKAYNLSPAEVTRFNSLSGNKLPVAGEEIFLPTPVIVSL